MASIRRLRSNEWEAYRDLRLGALEDSPDAFGGTFAAEAARPAEEWRERVAVGTDSPTDLPLVIDHVGKLAGLAWGRVLSADPNTAHLFQMWVAPDLRGQGFGLEMVRSIIEWARSVGAVRVVLRVTEGDTAARRLYERAGFVADGMPEPLRPGSVRECQPMRLQLTAGAF